jgi:cell division protein FtsB
MRVLSFTLIVLLCIVHSELWLGKNGVFHVMRLQAQLHDQQQKNQEAQQRNARLTAEVADLKNGLETVEEKARYELGMIRPNEILVRLPAPAPSKANAD